MEQIVVLGEGSIRPQSTPHQHQIRTYHRTTKNQKATLPSKEGKKKKKEKKCPKRKAAKRNKEAPEKEGQERKEKNNGHKSF